MIYLINKILNNNLWYNITAYSLDYKLHEYIACLSLKFNYRKPVLVRFIVNSVGANIF